MQEEEQGAEKGVTGVGSRLEMQNSLTVPLRTETGKAFAVIQVLLFPLLLLSSSCCSCLFMFVLVFVFVFVFVFGLVWVLVVGSAAAAPFPPSSPVARAASRAACIIGTCAHAPAYTAGSLEHRPPNLPIAPHHSDGHESRLRGTDGAGAGS
eukprot:3705697-Rhodomonas_salina.3